jgi:UDP-glucose-4-epimerase GalE
MRVLVTGGAGYVGSHAVRALQRAGHEVSVLDNLSRGHRETIQKLGVPLLELDLREPEALEHALAPGYDAVIHFAALALVQESTENPDLYWDVNFKAGRNLLEAMRRSGVQRLIVSSTAAVYGEPEATPIVEGSRKIPVNPYGASKLAFEYALEGEARSWGLRFVALRYFNACGASDERDLGERHDPETHLIPRLVRAVREREPFELYGRDHPTRDGTCLRDFIHVEDLARAHVLALERLDLAHGKALNLGTGTGRTVLEVVRTAERVLGKSALLVERRRRPGDPGQLVADPSLAERALGFRTERSLEDAIRSHDEFLERAA